MRKNPLSESPTGPARRAVVASLHNSYRYAVPILMTVIASVQFILGKTTTLTAWKGGGFGMFSTVDGSDRAMFVTITDVQGKTFVVSEEAFKTQKNLVEKIRAFPTQDRLDKLAKVIEAQRWRPDAATKSARIARSSDPQTIAVERIGVEVYRLQYVAGSGRVVRTKLAEWTNGRTR